MEYIEKTRHHVRYYYNDKLHREDGPAVYNTEGSLFWYRNGLLHREDGPAMSMLKSGMMFWYVNGKLILTLVDRELCNKEFESFPIEFL